MTKSNREAAATMGGNVLDEQMAAGYRWSRRPAETHEVVSAQPGYLITGCLDEPTVDGFSDSAPSPREQVKGRSRQHPVARLRLMGIGDKFGDREQVTAERIEEVIAGFRVHPFVPVCHRFEYGQDAIGWIKRLEFDGGTLSAHVEWNAMMPVRPRCSWGLSAEVMLDARDPLTGARRGWRLTSAKPRTEPQSEPTSPREQVKSRAREALNRSRREIVWHDNMPCPISIAREQNSGQRDTYVVRLDGAPQFTTYDAEEALDIFADMVTGEQATAPSEPVFADDAAGKRYAQRGAVAEVRMGDRAVRVAVAPGDTDAVVAANMRAALSASLRVVVGPDGRKHAVKIPSQADLDAARNPDPAPRQVWVPPESACPKGWTYPDGTLTVSEVDGRTVRFRDSACADAEYMTPEHEWRCIGVETPRGRVMVGDCFDDMPRLDPHSSATVTAFSIVAVVNGTRVRRRFGDGGEGDVLAAEVLDPGSGYRRTSYAPAREGQQYRNWQSGETIRCVKMGTQLAAGEVAVLVGTVADPAQWERLDPGQTCNVGAGAAPPLALSHDNVRIAGRTLSRASLVPTKQGFLVRGQMDLKDACALRDRGLGAFVTVPVLVKGAAAEDRVVLLHGISITSSPMTRHGLVDVELDLMSPTDANFASASFDAIANGARGAADAFRRILDALPFRAKPKPRAFAPGQVWTSPWAGVQRATLTRPDPDDPDIYWSFEESPVDGMPIAALTDDHWFYLGTKADLEDAARRIGSTAIVRPIGRTLATPGGIPAAAPEPTEEQRIAARLDAAEVDRLLAAAIAKGTPRREGEDDAALTARLDAAEVDRLLAAAIAKGRPWLVGVAYVREGHTVTLPDARAFTAALDALAAERDVDAAVETFRRARMATGPTWLRPALERAARELTGTTAERHEQAAPRVQRTRWADPCAWAEAVNFWERETR